jgi:hypothetical protein
MEESLQDLAKYKSVGAKPIVEMESEDWELSVYPKPEQQYANAAKYMTYDSISTGVGGK